MSTDKNKAPAVITIAPTRITTISMEQNGCDTWHSRFVRPIVVATVMAGITWVVSVTASLVDTSASFWIGIAGMTATGLILYRELLRSGLVLNRIVGGALVLVTTPLPVAFSIAPFLQVSPTLLAAISVGMAVGWLGHALGLLKTGDVPCTTAA